MNMSDKWVFKNVSGFYSGSSSYQKLDKTRHHLIIDTYYSLASENVANIYNIF